MQLQVKACCETNKLNVLITQTKYDIGFVAMQSKSFYSHDTRQLHVFFSSKTVEKSMLITDTNNQFIKFRCLFFKLLVIFKEVFKIKTF